MKASFIKTENLVLWSIVYTDPSDTSETSGKKISNVKVKINDMLVMYVEQLKYHKRIKYI